MAELQKTTQSYRFKTEDEKPKEFIITYNGENIAINTKGAFIERNELGKAIHLVEKEVLKSES